MFFSDKRIPVATLSQHTLYLAKLSLFLPRKNRSRVDKFTGYFLAPHEAAVSFAFHEGDDQAGLGVFSVGDGVLPKWEFVWWVCLFFSAGQEFWGPEIFEKNSKTFFLEVDSDGVFWGVKV